MKHCAVTIVNPLGLHARAAAKFVHVASGFSCSIRVRGGRREIDGKSIMGLLLLSAAPRHQHHDFGGRPRRGATPSPRCVRWSSAGSTSSRARDGTPMQLTGLGVSPGVGIGRAVVLRRGDWRDGVRHSRQPRRAGEIERLHAARERAREQLRQIKARIIEQRRRGTRLPLRRPAADARRPHAHRASGRDHRPRARERGSALQRTLAEISAFFDRGDDPYLRERKGDVADIVGAPVRQPALGGGPGRSVQARRGPARARRARTDAVAGRATRLAADRGPRERRGELDVPLGDPRAFDPDSGGRRAPQRQRDRHARATGCGGRFDW